MTLGTRRSFVSTWIYNEINGLDLRGSLVPCGYGTNVHSEDIMFPDIRKTYLARVFSLVYKSGPKLHLSTTETKGWRRCTKAIRA